MGKERRVAGPTRRTGSTNHRGTPYDRPAGGAHRVADGGDTDLVENDRLGESSHPPHGKMAMRDRDADRRSSWSSWVYTPLKALKESYMYLSKSPVKGEEANDSVGGVAANQTASSTAAAVIEEGEANSQKVADQNSSWEEQAGPSRPVDMKLPERLLRNQPAAPGAFGGVTPSRPAGASEGAGSSYEDIRARNVTLLSNSPLAAGSPWQPRLRPGSASLQPSPAQSSGAAGTPLGQQPLSMSSRPFASVGPSRFGLRDGPGPSPLALTPVAQTSRPRGNRAFARTPIHIQSLSTGVPVSKSSNAAVSAAAAAPEPAPLSWTPMRAYSSMQPRTGGPLSLKRGRLDGSPLGTPLLGAGLAAESERRTRQRREQGVGGAERRVWKAGQTPFHPRRSPSSEPMAIEGPPTAQPASREPLPMTESARRIAMALDAMLPTSSSQGQPEPSAASVPERPIPPPSSTLGVAPQPLPSSAVPAPATSALEPPMKAVPPPASSVWALQPLPATSREQPGLSSALAASQSSQAPGVAPAVPPTPLWSNWSSRPTISLPLAMDLSAGTSGAGQSPGSPTPKAQAALPLTPVVPSLPQTSQFTFGNAQKVAAVADGSTETEALEGVVPKFSFRPARSLLDSAEKAEKPAAQPQLTGATPEKVLEENNRAAAAAAQPLPESDEEEEEQEQDEDGSEDGDVKGVMRSSDRAKENGCASAATAGAPAAASGGWDLSFLKENQEKAAAAASAAKEAIEVANGGGEKAEQKASQPQPSATGKPAAAGGWDLSFLNANKRAADAAAAAAKAELDKAAGKSSSGPAPAPFTISFGKQETPAPDAAASTGSGLLSFLETVVPGTSSTVFAPSTSSGFTFGKASEPPATSAATAAVPSSATRATAENGDTKAPEADQEAAGQLKKAKFEETSTPKAGFSFGGTALPFSFPAAASSSAASTNSMLSGLQPAGLRLGGALADATASAAASEAPAAISPSGAPAALPFGEAASGLPAPLAFGAPSQPASSAAATGALSFGATSAAASQPEEAARTPSTFQLKPSAAPFAPISGFNFGKPAADADKAAQVDAEKLSDSAAASTGLSLTEAKGSGRSLDSNMSVSPSAGSAGAANPFVALETGPAPELPSTTGFPAPSFLLPQSSSAAASSFTFGAATAAAPAASKSLIGGTISFGAGSAPAFGAQSTPAFGAADASAPALAFGAGASSAAAQQSGLFGAGASSAFGAPASAPAFGAPAASVPAFGATQSGSLAFGASSTPAFGAASTPAFGAGSTPVFGASSTPAFGQQASAPAFGAGSAPAFGSFGVGAFGASAPAFGGFGSSSGAFGAPQPAAAAPFGVAHTAPAWGAPGAAIPVFGQAPQQVSANAAPGPFGAPTHPAFGMQQQQQQQPPTANPFGFQGAPSDNLGGDAASGFTMGAGDSQQQGQLARRKVKVKRKGR